MKKIKRGEDKLAGKDGLGQDEKDKWSRMDRKASRNGKRERRGKPERGRKKGTHAHITC